MNNTKKIGLVIAVFTTAVIVSMILTMSLITNIALTGYDTEVFGTEFSVDLDNNTISDGENLYRFEIEDFGGERRYIVTYPDGAEAEVTDMSNGGYSVVYPGYDEDLAVYNEDYADAVTLAEVLRGISAEEENTKNLPLAFLCIVLGIVNVAAPRAAWKIECGWHYRNAEPSDYSISAARVCGAAIFLIGVVILFV